MSIRLQNGSRVCIIGGGPAGSFSALHLLRLAQEHGIHLDVLIFEPRDFCAGAGRESCKGCAGILSAGMVRNFSGLNITLPPQVIQAELRAYVVHVYGQVTAIEQPDPQRRILSVYRGTGPRLHQGEPCASFDGYLLAQACERGAQLIPHRARLVEWDQGPVVQTAHESFRADLVVLASGVNSRPPLGPAFGYQPPATAVMAQEEVPRPENWPDYKVAGFFGQPKGVAFGAIVPKGPYLNVSLLGQEETASDVVRRFYESQEQSLGRFFPAAPQSLCSCTARIAVGPARVYFGDRWVAVGDAAVSRLYKDGIYSAFLTSGAAMRTAVEEGIARQDWRHAYSPFCRGMATDNAYGELLFKLSLRAMQNSLVACACVECIRSEANWPVDRRIFSRLMWGMLTGDEAYRDLFWLALKPRAMMGLSRELIRAARQCLGAA